MSNIIAGDIFQKIIQDVINSSSTDFEENGVNQQTLTELQQTWQQKLSARNVAQMPWDPKPQPPPQAPPVQNNQGPMPTTMAPYAGNVQAPSNGAPRIKPEPGSEPGLQGLPQANGYAQPGLNPAIAHQRAAMHMQQQFGSQANASLGAMQRGGIALPGQQRPQGLQLPQNHNPQQLQQQYSEQMKRQAAAQAQQAAAQQPRVKQENAAPHPDQVGYQQQQQQPNGGRPSNLQYAQNDGSGDAMDEWQQYMSARRALAADQVSANDHMMRDHIAELAAGLENGLMVPLSQQRKKTASKKRTHVRRSAPNTSSGPSIPQLDGELSDDEKRPVENDEDAINSDLDSSGDEAANAEDDDDDIDSMLCTYDKVQRVKNKWKCTLKDGILLANGKEYIFHKAQGEFEW